MILQNPQILAKSPINPKEGQLMPRPTLSDILKGDKNPQHKSRGSNLSVP